MSTIRVRFGCLLFSDSLAGPFSSFFSRFTIRVLFGSQAFPKDKKQVWNRTLKHPLLTIYNALSLLSLFLSHVRSFRSLNVYNQSTLSLSRFCFVSDLCLVLSSFPDRCVSTIPDRNVLGACFSGPLHVFPDRDMATIRVLFGCLLFWTAAGLSGPWWLQLEYVLGACFSGPLHVFPDRTMSTIRVRFGCLLFRTAAGLSGPRYLQLEYVLGACFSGPLQVFPDRDYLQLEYFLGACFSGPLQVFPDHNVYN